MSTKRIQAVTYEVNGHRFTLLPTTPRNREALQGIFDNRDVEQEAYLKSCKAALLSGADMPIESYGDREFYYDIFRTLTSGPHEMIEPDDFDHKVAEMVLADFLPAPALTSLVQSGFLPYQTR